MISYFFFSLSKPCCRCFAHATKKNTKRKKYKKKEDGCARQRRHCFGFKKRDAQDKHPQFIFGLD